MEKVEWLVIDDGSADKTSQVAAEHGADHVVRLPRNQGLAGAFVCGLEVAVEKGADIIVNTDADNQYCAADIPKLIEPILSGKAEIVLGARDIAQTAQFSWIKKLLQRLGSWVVRLVSGTDVPDAPSGFRAMSREAAMRLKVFNEYTYTLETIIQAGMKGMAIESVPVRINEALRPSHLFGNVELYFKTISDHHPNLHDIQAFLLLCRSCQRYFLAGFLIGLRFTYYYVIAGGAGHVQSLILAGLLMGSGFFLFVVGLLADLVSVNRKLLEGLDWRIRKIEEKTVSKD